MSLEDHAEELASDLGVDKEEVTRDLENLVNYSVPMDEAKQSLRRKYGDGSSGNDGTPSSKAISEVSTDDSNVTVTAVVLTSGRRSIQYNGEQHVIREGELADETGKISYTAWDGFSGDLQPGQTVRLGNAGVREWDGRPELNLGDSTDPEVVDETLDIDYDVGGRAALQDLAPGDRGITVEVQVLECEQKVIDGRDGETTILSGVLGDESGRLPFTDWEPHDEIEEGASVRLEETFVREFRGAPSVNVSEFSAVTALDRTVEVAEDAPRLSIRGAVESGGLFDVELAGNVIEVRDGSGLIERCPECGRVVQNGQCRSHGAVEGEDDLRTKAILDDGTDTVTAVLDDELTARVYGGDLDDAREHARDAMDKEVVADRIADRIVGREYVVRGSLSVDEYGANLTASTFTEADDDPATRAQALLQEADT
ncbi:Single-stranded DNA binding protein [Haloarcula sp. CBA1130]|uniref:Single-stranded DNA binding protein n=1 Tax=unclassified Haloarcula TaxID=2624677 RepID=UPI0012492D1D|nr:MULTISPECIES: Single-stranded DNA binding protein [unclassified Haloarcula]KAA9397917.1 Single-stranded DNA binding protein [Haloarcula sp. CBA1129]KAA9402394.1 Single-stranded DNA binding protein [Haloarcula sp. CBA1130]